MKENFYRLNDKLSFPVLALGALQWFVFMIASDITVPVVVGPALGLSPHETASFIDRTLFVSGIVGILQITIGHRYPIVEGPAGMWWGVFLVLIQMTTGVHQSLGALRSELELGLILAGVLYVLLAVFGLVRHIQRLFTPIVTGTFMVLLSLQLSESLVKGMLGLEDNPTGRVDGRIALFSLLLIVLTVVLMVLGRGLIRNLAILIGLFAGWLLYAVFGLVKFPSTHGGAFVQLPAVFPFGTPTYASGVVITSLFTALILLSNLITSVHVMGSAADEPASKRDFRFGTLVTGIGTAICGLFGVVGNVPLSTSAGLVTLSKMAARLPYLVASVLLALLGLAPAIGKWLVTLPSPVGYAVLFTAFGQMVGFGLADLKQVQLDSRAVFVIGLSILSGAGMFFVPSTAWEGLPQLIGYLLDNGLILGVVLVLLLEHIVFRRRKEPAA